jgi:hypothetical protein
MYGHRGNQRHTFSNKSRISISGLFCIVIRIRSPFPTQLNSNTPSCDEDVSSQEREEEEEEEEETLIKKSSYKACGILSSSTHDVQFFAED